MAEETDQPLIFETRDAIAVITLNRPARRNAINGAMAAAMEDALDVYEADRELRCAIITGAGQAFCSGADLHAAYGAEAGPGPSGIIRKNGGFAGLVRRQRRKPLIAAVNGAAAAGGFEIALACDLIVASEDARFLLPEAGVSLVAAAGALIRLPRLIGLNRAQELILTGAAISAAQAHDWGIVNRLAAPGEALQTALELAREIAAHAPLAVAANRTLAARAFESDEDEEADLWRAGFAEAEQVAASADFKEGIKAFQEKRPPRWRGE